MKSKRFVLIFLIFFLFINNCSIINPVDIEKKNRMISQIITYALNNFHYTDKELNNDLSDKIFNEFFSYIDYGKRYFLQSDIDKFRKNKEYFDNYFLDGNYNYIYEIFDTFLIRVKEGRNITEEILSKPLDFDKEEKVQLDGKKREYCKNRKELKEYWRKYLKYRTVLRYFDIIEERKNKDEKTDIDYSSIEKEARKRVKKAMDQFFKRLLDFDKKEQFDIYVNAVTRIFDTHSSYFSPYEKENFDLEMSGKFEGIGAVLSESEGNVKVVRIVPGGPAWKEGNLEAEDVILKVKPGKEEDFQSLLGLGVDDAVKLIRGKKGKPVILTVRKPDGRIKDIKIVRDVVTLEETYAKSSILQLKNKNRKIGYIKLPKFYHDFNDSKGRRSSDDVKNQIEYLKDNGIEGLILDLRNNSGGALRDAIKTAGLFIEDGPIVQVRGRRGKISVLRDLNKNIIYEKPLIILINKFSASASEIVAAALRDYGRAVIVGSEQSYGKGTVQNMIRLDDL
ncbi:MAG TPA: S41 family peptidase, partial [Candidatus Mcinerneyibacterium sp.]|nr:S41 family peptidase [Candidatus Mcinerneyibacterium sp.]